VTICRQYPGKATVRPRPRKKGKKSLPNLKRKRERGQTKKGTSKGVLKNQQGRPPQELFRKKKKASCRPVPRLQRNLIHDGNRGSEKRKAEVNRARSEKVVAKKATKKTGNEIASKRKKVLFQRQARVENGGENY